MLFNVNENNSYQLMERNMNFCDSELKTNRYQLIFILEPLIQTETFILFILYHT